MLAENPDQTAKEIVDAMAAKGLKVTPNLVYFLKAKATAKKRRAVRQKVAATATVNGQDPVVIIKQVKALSQQVGGIVRLKEIVEAMA